MTSSCARFRGRFRRVIPRVIIDDDDLIHFGTSLEFLNRGDDRLLVIPCGKAYVDAAVFQG